MNCNFLGLRGDKYNLRKHYINRILKCSTHPTAAKFKDVIFLRSKRLTKVQPKVRFLPIPSIDTLEGSWGKWHFAAGNRTCAAMRLMQWPKVQILTKSRWQGVIRTPKMFLVDLFTSISLWSTVKNFKAVNLRAVTRLLQLGWKVPPVLLTESGDKIRTQNLGRNGTFGKTIDDSLIKTINISLLLPNHGRHYSPS